MYEYLNIWFRRLIGIAEFAGLEIAGIDYDGRSGKGGK